jgi:predicted dehydrogenase
MFRTLLGVVLVSAIALPAAAQEQLKVGIIGLDTSHAIAFTKELNNPKAETDVAGCPVVAVYPKGSPDIESSTSRVPGYTAEIEKLGVRIVPSIDELLKQVDCVLLETNDGRPHLEQALPVFQTGKPVFIDKPVAGTLADAIAIYKAAAKYNCPTFSSSSLRYAKGAQELRSGALGKILGCDAYSPCSLEPTHPDLYWYGIHGCETLFTVMGPGCESVTRVATPEFDLAVGKWKDGRIGTFRGIRSKGGSGYGGTAFGEKGVREIGSSGGYRPLIVEIVKFFKTKKSPIDAAETLNLYAFMEAADESKRKGGAPATIEEVMKKAEADAEKRLAALGVK